MVNELYDTLFNDEYQKNHPNDYSLVCHNNFLNYSGETKTISSTIIINTNSRLNLFNFKISDLDYIHWQLPSYQLFFYIGEAVKFMDSDIKQRYISNITAQLNKNNIDGADRFNLDCLIDYYQALASIEPALRTNVYDIYMFIKNSLLKVASKNQYALTDAEKYIYNKVFDMFQKDMNLDGNENSSSNSSSNNRGYTRTNSKLPSGVHFAEPIDKSQEISNGAFISVVALVILILAIVVGTMTYIFS